MFIIGLTTFVVIFFFINFLMRNAQYAAIIAIIMAFAAAIMTHPNYVAKQKAKAEEKQIQETKAEQIREHAAAEEQGRLEARRDFNEKEQKDKQLKQHAKKVWNNFGK